MSNLKTAKLALKKKLGSERRMYYETQGLDTFGVTPPTTAGQWLEDIREQGTFPSPFRRLRPGEVLEYAIGPMESLRSEAGVHIVNESPQRIKVKIISS